MIRVTDFFKSKRRVLFLSGALCVAVIGGILLTSGVSKVSSEPMLNKAESMYRYKPQYVGDNSKIVNLISNLSYADFRGEVSIKLANTPYSVDVNYDFSTANMDVNQIEPNFYSNAVILFSLISNVDIINFHLKGSSGKPEYNYTRDEVQKGFDRDLKEYGKDIDAFKGLLNKLSLKLFAYPGSYTPAMSSTPGIRIIAEYEGQYTSVNYSTQYGSFLTWDAHSGEIKVRGKTIELSKGLPVYWTPLNENINAPYDGAENIIIKASILNNSKNVLADGEVNIKCKDSMFCTVQPSYGVVIGREAKVSAAHVEKKLADIDTGGSNKLFSELTKYDSELNSFPYWIGTKEYIINGVRYIYETSQSKTDDGYDLITFKKKKEDGTLVKEYKYKIAGSDSELME